MIELLLVGIGTGNPEHLTLQAIRALNSADLILIPRKGPEKSDLADLRRSICAKVLTSPTTRIAEFEMPLRNRADADYRGGVDAWHDAIAAVWSSAVRSELGDTRLPGTGDRVDKATVALLVWGDPALFDSTLRIAARLDPSPQVRVIPGITSMQALCASHAIPLNEIGAPFLVTTGRRLRDEGWPADGYRGDYIADVAKSYLAGETVTADDRAVTAKGDVETALMQCAELRTSHAENPAGFVEAAMVLMRLDRLTEAEPLLTEGSSLFPNELALAIDRAWVAHRRRDWDEAVRRWDHVRDRFPHHSAGYTGAAASLRGSQHHNLLYSFLRSIGLPIWSFMPALMKL